MAYPSGISPRPPAWAAVFCTAAALLLAGCNVHYGLAQALEAQNRWEEAAIEYHLAVLEDPEIEEYREALERAHKVVARENLELYRKFLAKKQFRKAYNRLIDASRQDPALEAVQLELGKWLRVLVAGQVRFEFRSLRANVNLADEIKLMVRLNTPDPGRTTEAEIDLDTGTFSVEDILYDRPDELLFSYSLNSVGVSLVFGRSRVRSFSSREFRRFVNFRTPVLDEVSGRISLERGRGLKSVSDHRREIAESQVPEEYWAPRPNPHYTMKIGARQIFVSAKEGRTYFTPKFLYMNKKDRRLFVDFGRYRVLQNPKTRRWALRRLPIGEEDYFAVFSRNIALQPYFFYREGVFAYVNNGGK